MAIKIATWNVNSLRVRLPVVQEWLLTHQPDILALQETKVPDNYFPSSNFEELGYHTAFIGQKSYNGVAILSRAPLEDITTHFNIIAAHEARFISGTLGGIRFINLYVPNGANLESDKYIYKLNFLEALYQYLECHLNHHKQIFLLGDFNIAPKDEDVYDPVLWQNQVLVSPAERKYFDKILSLGFTDVFRFLEPGTGFYSWWDYRQAAFRRNQGLRIDHILASDAVLKNCIDCYIDKVPRGLERPSDHAPVVLTANF